MKKPLNIMSISQLSKITGYDRDTISKRLDAVPVVQEDGRAKLYDTKEVLSILYSHETNKIMNKKLDVVIYEQEKAKLEKLRIDNDRKLGKLVGIDEVVTTVMREQTFIKMQLKAIPSKLSKILSIATDPVKIYDLLHEELNKSFSELTSDQVYLKFLSEVENESNETNQTDAATTGTSQESAENTEAAVEA